MKLGVIAVMNNFPPIFVGQSFSQQAKNHFVRQVSVLFSTCKHSDYFHVS